MLRVGLTGGIGSGKSTVARRLVQRGALVVDSDLLAREVVAPGTDGLARIVEAFGPEVVGPDGGLDRPALAARVFGDPAARARLNGIVHPLVRARSEVLHAAAPADAIVVSDVPLLVENRMAASFPLVVVVHTPQEERIRRVVADRGMGEADVRARVGAQASDDDRRAAADVWLDNTGSSADLAAALDTLWARRLVPFEANLRERRPVPAARPVLVEPDPCWAEQAARLTARVAAAAGTRGRGVAHIGSTAVPGLPAKDVLDLQLAVASPAEADALADALAEAGFPSRPEIVEDIPKPAGGPPWPKRLHGGADPGRVVHLHVREHGSPGWRFALLFRDWLRADPTARADYLAVKRAAADRARDDPDGRRYAQSKEPYFDAAADTAEAWAVASGWEPRCEDP